MDIGLLLAEAEEELDKQRQQQCQQRIRAVVAAAPLEVRPPSNPPFDHRLTHQVLLIVLSYLGPQELLQCRLVCQKWCLAASSGSLWKSACQALHPLAKKQSGHCSWMHWYFENERRCRFIADQRAERATSAANPSAAYSVNNRDLHVPNEEATSAQLLSVGHDNSMEVVRCSACDTQFLRCLNKVGACMRHPGRLEGVRWSCCHAVVQRAQLYGVPLAGTPAAARGCTPCRHDEPPASR